jgi:hypothetical protein
MDCLAGNSPDGLRGAGSGNGGQCRDDHEAEGNLKADQVNHDRALAGSRLLLCGDDHRLFNFRDVISLT